MLPMIYNKGKATEILICRMQCFSLPYKCGNGSMTVPTMIIFETNGNKNPMFTKRIVIPFYTTDTVFGIIHLICLYQTYQFYVFGFITHQKDYD